MSGYLRRMARKQAMDERKLLHHVVREHEEVLRDIEAVFARAFQQAEDVDDAVALECLEAVLEGRAPRDARALVLVGRIERVRGRHRYLPEQDWGDSLTVVMQSVRRHHLGIPGSVNYLHFVSAFFE